MGIADDIINGTYEPSYKRKKTSIADQIISGTYKSSADLEREKRKKELEEKKKKEEKRSWFEKGAFSDGYQFGDVSRTILGTANDVTQDVVAGIVEIPEKVIDAGAYAVGGVGNLFRADDFADDMKKFIAKDILDSNKVATRVINTSPAGMVNNLLNGDIDNILPIRGFEEYNRSLIDDTNIESNSLLGEKSDSLMESAGQLAGTIGLQAVGVPWQVTTGVTSFGSEVENAFNNDATYGEAGLSATISTAAELLTETLFKIPGIKATGSGKFGEKIISKLSEKFGDTIGRNFLNWGISSLGEGGEEVITSFVQRLGQSLTYEKESTVKELIENEDLRNEYFNQVAEKLFSKEAWSEYGEAFVGGAALGGTFGIPKLRQANQQGRDINTGLTANEQTVLDKVAEKQIAEAEKDGKKLTNKEKNKILEEVQEDLQKGLIDTADIESILGGESYTRLQDTNTRVENLKKEIAEIENKPNTEATVKDIRRLNSLEQRLKEIDTTELQNNLQTEVFNKIGKDNYLQRSYYEKAQRGVRFTQEIKEDASEIKKAAYSSASEVMHNTTRSHQLVETAVKIGEATNTKFIFVNNEKLKRYYKDLKEGTSINGLVNKKGEVLINVQGNNIFEKIVGHETTHLLEGTKEYKLLQEAVKEYATIKGEYDTKLQSLTKLYEGTDANVENEITSDLVGDYIFTDEEFVNHLSAKQPNVFKKVYDYIKHLVKQVAAGSKEARQLEKVRYRFEQAYRNVQKSVQNGQNAKYSISDDIDSKISDEIDSRISEELDIEDRDIDEIAARIFEDTYKPSQQALEDEDVAYDEEMEFSNQIYEAVKQKLEELGYDRYDGGYNAETKLYNAREEIIDFLSDNNIDYEESNSIYAGLFPSIYVKDANGDVVMRIGNHANSKGSSQNYTNKEIVQDTKKILNDIKQTLGINDVKYSLTDNQGRELTSEQQEYFKDSKVRDEEDRLLEVYHGTERDFNMYKSEFGEYFFTDNENAAYDYGSKVKKQYLNFKNPYIVDFKGENDKGIFDAIDYAKANGYDGVIAKNTYDGANTHNQYVAFNSNQIKNVDNTNPTSNPDTRYSLTDNKGRKLTTEQQEYFKDSKVRDENGNLLQMYHGSTADFTVFDKEKIGSATGTPMFGKGFYFTNRRGEAKGYSDNSAMSAGKIYRTYLNITNPYLATDDDIGRLNTEELKKQGYDGIKIVHGSAIDYVVFEPNQIKNVDNLNPTDNPDIRYSLSEDGKLVDDKGNDVTLEVEQTNRDLLVMHNLTEEKLNALLDIEGIPTPSLAITKAELNPRQFGGATIVYGKDTINPTDKRNEVYNADIYSPRFPETKNIVDEEGFEQFSDKLESKGMNYGYISSIREYIEDNDIEGVRRILKRELPENTTDDEIKALYQEAFSYISEKRIINPNIEIFTPSGTRRSLKARSLPYTLENLVKIMTKKSTQGSESNFITSGTIRANMSQRFKSIDEIKGSKENLKTSEEMKQIIEAKRDELDQIANELTNYYRYKDDNYISIYDIVHDSINETARAKKQDISTLKAKLEENFILTENMPTELLQKTIDFLNSLKNMPTQYFEAKPQRAIYWGEEVGILIPNDFSAEVKQKAIDKGLNVIEYDPEIEGDYESKLNQSFEDAKFSLSDPNTTVPRQRGLTYSEDVMFNEEEAIAPLQQEINNLSNKITELMGKITVNEDDYAPIGENELSQLEQQNSQNFQTLDDDIAPVEVEEDFVDEETPTASKSLFDTRDYEEVGNRKVKAYQYEHPEVRPYFQKAAKEMLMDLNDTIKGERSFNSQLYYDSNGEDGFYGTTRHTAKDIAELLDGIDGRYKLSYAEIRKGLEAIIEDHGAENNAASKRIEFYLDQRLRNGYVDTMGYDIPADKEYLDLMESKEYHSYFDNIPIDESLIPEPEEELVETNIGKIPVAEYRDIMAQQSGFDNYADMRRQGFKLGNKYDTEVENTTEVTNNNIVEPFEGVPTQRELDLESGDIIDETVSELEKKKARERKKLGDKENYIKNKVTELYDEAKALKKGVRASYDLSRLLDFAFQDIDTITKDMTPEDAKAERDRIWRDITNSFMNIKVKPFETVNPNSKIEARIRQYVGRQYDAKLDEINNLKDEDLKKITRADIKQGYINRVIAKFKEHGYDFEKILDNAKNKSTFSSVDNTPQRFVEKSLGYKEGQIFNDLTSNQTALNESEAIKWLNSFTNRKDGELAKISKEYNIKPFSKEDKAAQMYGEGFFVDDNNQIIKYGDGELAQDFPDETVRENIKKLAKDPRIRQIYDDTLNRINESRKRNGYPEIPRRNDYFLHFRAMEDTFSRMGLPFNPNDIRAKDLPTDLNGVTADLKPGQPYFASAKQRKGLKTSYSLLGGIEKYLSSAKNQIYHIDDIQMLRSLRDYVADRFGQAKGLENLDELTEEEIEQRIKEVFDAHLSNFAKFLNEQANVLAGKTTLIDRGLEGIIGRRGLTTLDTINSQVGKNLIAYSVASPFTNLVAGVQAFAKGNKFDSLKAFTQVASNKIKSIFGKSDGFMEKDLLAIRRQGADNFYRTPYQKISDYGYVLMGAIDNVTTEFTVRTKYNELTRKGMSHEKAMIEADKWAARILGDRSLGQQPQLYNSKLLGLITKFQLEVRNQLDSMIYDTIKEAEVSTEEIQDKLKRNRSKAAKITSTMVQLAVLQHLFGKAFESVIGYNPAFDIISVLMTAFGFDDEEESEDTVLDNLDQAFQELLGDLPYTSTLTGGRIPIEAALPIEELIKGEDAYGNEKSRLKTIGEALPYYILPGGYNQIKKTTQGLGMFDDDLPVSGSYTASGNLRYPVEDTIQNRIQAGIFGQYANENARDYFDNERLPLKEKQIQEYIDLDMPIKDYWKYRDGLKDLDKLEDKIEYVNKQNVTTEQKNIMVNNLTDRKEKIDMSNYNDFGSLEEFDFANGKDTKEKYEFLQANNISYKEYNASEESRKAYNWAYENPESYIVSKAVTDDLVTYRKYKQDLAKFKDIKDENGKVLVKAQTQKENYINNLNISYEAKIILYKSEYSSAKEYDEDIINYLNSRDDLSYEEKITIVNKLDK